MAHVHRERLGPTIVQLEVREDRALHIDGEHVPLRAKHPRDGFLPLDAAIHVARRIHPEGHEPFAPRRNRVAVACAQVATGLRHHYGPALEGSVRGVVEADGPEWVTLRSPRVSSIVERHQIG